MLFLFITISVIILIISGYLNGKRRQVANLSHKAILTTHQHALRVHITLFVVSIIALIIGYILPHVTEMSVTVEYENWFRKGVYEKTTTAGYWSMFLKAVGYIIGTVTLIGIFDRGFAILKYKNMSNAEYQEKQQKAIIEIEEERIATEKREKRGAIISILKIFFG